MLVEEFVACMDEKKRASTAAQQVRDSMPKSKNKGPTMSYSDLQNRLGGVEAFAAQAKRPLEDVRRDIATVKARIRRRNFMLLDPNSTFVQYWDLLTMLGLVYTITVTPFEVSDEIRTLRSHTAR